MIDEEENVLGKDRDLFGLLTEKLDEIDWIEIRDNPNVLEEMIMPELSVRQPDMRTLPSIDLGISILDEFWDNMRENLFQPV